VPLEALVIAPAMHGGREGFRCTGERSSEVVEEAAEEAIAGKKKEDLQGKT